MFCVIIIVLIKMSQDRQSIGYHALAARVHKVAKAIVAAAISFSIN